MRQLSELTNEELSEFEPEIISMLLEKWMHFKKTGQALEDQAKLLMSEGIDVPNWHLSDGATKRNITSPAEATTLLLKDDDLGIKPSDLLKICLLPPAGIRGLIMEKTGLKQQDAQERMAQVLGDVLTETKNKPSLKRGTKKKKDN